MVANKRSLMSDYEQWERENAIHPVIAIILAMVFLVLAGVCLYYPISRYLYDYPDYSIRIMFISIGLSGMFLFGFGFFVYRVVKGKPIPYVAIGGDPPPGSIWKSWKQQNQKD